MTTWCIRIACWIPNASNIPSEYVIHIVLTRKQLRTHLNAKFLRTLFMVINVSFYYQHIFITHDVWIINRWNYTYNYTINLLILRTVY